LKHEEPAPGVDSTPEQRRAAAEKVFERATLSGMPIEDDQRFIAWIDEWIAGDLTMAQVSQRYGQLLEARRKARKMHMPEASLWPETESETEQVSGGQFTFDEEELSRMLLMEIDDDREAPKTGR
jgi:hypothetical protein